jgi:hypothetical protein
MKALQQTLFLKICFDTIATTHLGQVNLSVRGMRTKISLNENLLPDLCNPECLTDLLYHSPCRVLPIVQLNSSSLSVDQGPYSTKLCGDTNVPENLKCVCVCFVNYNVEFYNYLISPRLSQKNGKCLNTMFNTHREKVGTPRHATFQTF